MVAEIVPNQVRPFRLHISDDSRSCNSKHLQRTGFTEEEGEVHHSYPAPEVARAGVAEARRRVSAAVKVEVVAAKAVAAAVQLLFLLLLLLLLLSPARRRVDTHNPRGDMCYRNAGSTHRLAWRTAVGRSQSTGRWVRRARPAHRWLPGGRRVRIARRDTTHRSDCKSHFLAAWCTVIDRNQSTGRSVPRPGTPRRAARRPCASWCP